MILPRMNRIDLRRATLLLASLAVIAPVGFYSKRGYHGPAAAWVHDSLGGLFYEIFWCLVIALLRPSWRPARVAVTVLIATCALEFLQLWHPAPLEWLRGFFIGRTILGTYFDWSDFPYYFAGSALGWMWLRLIPPSRSSPESTPPSAATRLRA